MHLYLTENSLITWNDQQTRLLLDTYKEHKNDMGNPRNKKEWIWEKIARELRASGVLVSSSQVIKKLFLSAVNAQM